MTRSEINQLSLNSFLTNIERLKATKDITEYRIMNNCKIIQPEFKQRGIISQVRYGRKKYISLAVILLIAQANNFPFIIE